MKLLPQLGIIFFGFILTSCTKYSQNRVTISEDNLIRYANNLDIVDTEEGLLVTIGQAYKGATSSKKYLLTNVVKESYKTDLDAIIKIPIKSMVATATSQVGFIDELEAGSLLTGFTTTDFISSVRIRERIDSNQIVELGQDANINIEELIALSPDILIAYSASADVRQWEQVGSLGIPVVYDASFLETSPLAQAEWIKFFGALIGKTVQADSVFGEIEDRYLNLQHLTKDITSRPTVICGTMYNGTWFMPGGQSWVAMYIEDAGGEYLWKHIQQTGSVPLSFEAVYEKSLSANYWIGATAFKTQEQIIQEDARYLKFEVLRNNQIYSPTKRMNGFGGNDYYESAVVRPDLVLRDFIRILHPDVVPNYQLYYYKQLE